MGVWGSGFRDVNFKHLLIHGLDIPVIWEQDRNIQCYRYQQHISVLQKRTLFCFPLEKRVVSGGRQRQGCGSRDAEDTGGRQEGACVTSRHGGRLSGRKDRTPQDSVALPSSSSLLVPDLSRERGLPGTSVLSPFSFPSKVCLR